MNATISKIHAREILDSRGNPTIEVDLTLTDGSVGRAMVPSGASTGEHEVLEMRDHDPERYLGKGTQCAVRMVEDKIAPFIVGRKVSNLKTLDTLMIEMDGTNQKSQLGGNSILGVSLAFANAVSVSEKKPLFLVLNEMMGLTEADLRFPIPLMNILNGGMHANNGLEIQEFMIAPHGFETFSEALRAGVEVFHHLKKALHDKHLSTAVGDEGGFAPALKNNQEALDYIAAAVEKAGYELGKEISLALDCAASSFYKKASKTYGMSWEGKHELTTPDMLGYYATLVENYPLVSIEDPLDENDWSGWSALTAKLGSRVQLVGDDLFVTQAKFVKRGVDEKAANAVLIKVNQVGTLSETFDTMELCRRSGYRAVVSHRSGETEDVTIAHLAVGSGCGQIKTGSASRSERIAKYNELLRIEEWAKQNGRKIPFVDFFGR